MVKAFPVLAGLLVLPALAFAMPVTVKVSSAKPGTASALVRLLPEVSGAGSKQEEVRVRVDLPGEEHFDLPARSVWKVRAEAQGLWSEERIVAVDPERATDVSLRLFPAGRLTARWSGPPGEAVPSALTVRFAPSPADGPEGLPQATISCPVVDGSVTCELPAGRLDLRLRAEGFIPLYRWGVGVDHGRARDLGPLLPRRGASVAGWIETQAGEAPARPVRIELAPERLGAPERQGEWQRLRSVGLEAASNERGFFQIEGVAPGSYVLSIKEAGYAPIRVSPVVVREGLQTEVIDRLVLSPPVRLELSISPPIDPYGRPWRIQLREQRAYGDPAVASWQGTASREGLWVQGGLAPGAYQLAVADDEGGRWDSREISVEGNPAAVQVEVPVVEVRGSVTLGDEPLAATLWLGGQFGQRRVRFEADEEGRFQGLLPGEGLWKAEVVSQKERFRAPLDPVDVRVPPGKSYATVSLKVPATLLAGETVDEAGRKVAGALVSALATAAEVETDEEGEFEVRGLKPGMVLFEAEHHEASSGPVEALIKEEGESPRLRLVLRKKKEIQGRVASAWGPVPGAELLAFPAVDRVAGAAVVAAISGADGRFTLEVPSDVRQLTLLVFAPGYAMRLLPVSVDGKLALDIAVDTAGGTLVLDLPESQAGSPPPLLLHNGTFTLLPLLSRWVRLQGGAWQVPQSGRFTVPNVEIGDYRLCSADSSGEVRQGREPKGCASGFLAPSAELTLVPPAGSP